MHDSILSVEILVQCLNAPDLLLNLFSFLDHLPLLVLHPKIHFFELLLLHLKVLVLVGHDFLVLIQKVPHLVKLFVPQDLKFLKVGRNLVWRRDGTHLRDARLKQLVLGLHDSLVVPQELLHLDNRGHALLFVEDRLTY